MARLPSEQSTDTSPKVPMSPSFNTTVCCT